MQRLLFTLILTSPLTSANEIETCWDNAITQRAMNKCAAIENEQIEIQLDNLLNELKKELSAKQVKQLQSAQLAWEKMVEHDCMIEETYVEGGSAQFMITVGCYTLHTDQRIEQLAPLLCHPMLADCTAAEKYLADE